MPGGDSGWHWTSTLAGRAWVDCGSERPQTGALFTFERGVTVGRLNVVLPLARAVGRGGRGVRAYVAAGAGTGCKPRGTG